MMQKVVKPLRGERLALEYLKSYECSECGGKGSVQFGHIIVGHNVSRCSLARSLRMRFPGLSKVRG